MKRILILVVAVLVAVTMWAGRQFVVNNSPDGESTLTLFLPDEDKATGRAILDCPGGGYEMVCTGHEGVDWVEYFNDMGIAYAMLTYRLPHGDPSIPIGDAEHAMRMLRDSAAVWNINPRDVGIMGFSAGGHLASTVATHADFASRPDFQILFYPVITMSTPLMHVGSMKNLLGKDQDNEDVRRYYSNDLQVRRHITPPAIILMSDDDDGVPPMGNGVPYYQALRNNDISASMVIYPCGNHGWGFKKEFPFHEEMKATLAKWLQQLKPVRPDAVKVACVGNSITEGYGIAWSDIHGYPAVLQRLLGDGYWVKNYGISSRTLLNKGNLPYMKEYVWKDCKDFEPDVVVIKLGTNDAKPDNWQYSADFEKDLQQMVDELKALPSKPRIYLCYPIKIWENPWNHIDSLVTNGVIPKINKVAKRNKLQVIDLYTPFADSNEHYLEDGIHPDREGAAKIASIVAEQLLKKP